MSGDTLVVFESPHRVRATLKDALNALGDRRIAVCRELTKRYEEIWRGPITEALAHFTEPRGEFTLVIEGVALTANPQRSRAASAPPLSVDAAIAELRAAGGTSKDAIASLARAFGLSRREAYRLWHT